MITLRRKTCAGQGPSQVGRTSVILMEGGARLFFFKKHISKEHRSTKLTLKGKVKYLNYVSGYNFFKPIFFSGKNDSSVVSICVEKAHATFLSK